MSVHQNSLDLHNAGEQIMWKGGSSQLLNFKHYAGALVLVAASAWAAVHFDRYLILLVALAAMLYACYQYLVVKSATYTLTNQRIIRRWGLFNRTTFEIELYRVKDVHLYEPLQLRIFGLGNISLISSQRSTQLFELTAIREAGALREQLRHLVEKRRNEKGVGEYDTN